MIDYNSVHDSRKRFEALNVPVVYEKFPTDYHMHIEGWSSPTDTLNRSIDVDLAPEEVIELYEKDLLKKIECISGQVFRMKKLITLDIEIAADDVADTMNCLKDRYDAGEFLSRAGNIDENAINMEFARLYRETCNQRCPHCFNQEDGFYVKKIINGQKILKWEETKSILKQAKRLGLECVKFVGPGEMFKNPMLFAILNELREERIKIAIFTKGAALGDDEIAKSCGYEGISSAEDLVRRIAEYDNVSILLGANSFHPTIQDEMVGCGKDGGITEYTKMRDKALQLLVKHGLNNPLRGKRLALIATPVTPLVSDETIEMYEWAAKRNIPVITLPTALSGKGADELEWLFGQFETNETLVKRYDPKGTMTREQRYTEWLVDFYTDIYTKTSNMGILEVERMRSEGLSAYAGSAKCRQAHNGMYLRLPGFIQECPGRCIGAEIIEDVRTQSLLATWLGSRNYDRDMDCRSLCAVKMKDLTGSKEKACDCCIIYENVGSMPLELESRVIRNLEEIQNHI